MQDSTKSSAVWQALLVTFLWSTSWVFIKWGLDEVPALTFAGLRYALAFLILLPGLWRRREEVLSLGRNQWLQLAALGLLFYALTQGGQFLTLSHLDATPFSLILSFTALLVAATSALVLRETPSRGQWIGLGLALVGAGLYFTRRGVAWGGSIGWAFALLTLFANAGSSLLGRFVNRRHLASPWVVTTLSMGIGGACLLTSGLATQGLPALSLRGWGIVIWLAVVNTAFAFVLWNRSLRVLSATESSAINNTMMIQIAALAWILLGEAPSVQQVIGLLIVAVGTLLVQRPRRASS